MPAARLSVLRSSPRRRMDEAWGLKYVIWEWSRCDVQRSWVVDYVAPTAAVTVDDEELLIQLV